MAFILVSGTGEHGIFRGLSSDVKPTTGEGVEVGAKLIETDTMIIYRYDGTSWFPRAQQQTIAEITANQDDWDLGAVESARVSSDANREVTGITGGVDGRVIKLWNIGGFRIRLKDEDASSAAANRFTLLNAEFDIDGGASAYIEYDGTSSRWRVVEKG